MNQELQERIAEWAQSPINRKLVGAIQDYIDELNQSKGLDAYHPYEPQRTQEILANLNGCIDTLELVISLLDGDWSFLEEVDEQVGDQPEG